jgi:hypothetical protein
VSGFSGSFEASFLRPHGKKERLRRWAAGASREKSGDGEDEGIAADTLV